MLKVSEATVRRMADAGRIPQPVETGLERGRRWDLDEMTAFLKFRERDSDRFRSAPPAVLAG